MYLNLYVPGLQHSTAMVNHYYFYGVDEDFGPFFLKFCSYFPYNGRLYFNGHEYAKRQMSRNKIEYEVGQWCSSVHGGEKAAIQNEQLMFQKSRLCDNRAYAAGPSNPDDRHSHLKKKNDDISHAAW